ncbi:tectonic-1 [Panulirus ornatus]|uniref:tectonic-1 n=1 Tax=Panulirus ornatus TaxID=150431 RepID=UPI003A8B7106
MLSTGLFLRLMFYLLHIISICGQNYNDKNPVSEVKAFMLALNSAFPSLRNNTPSENENDVTLPKNITKDSNNDTVQEVPYSAKNETIIKPNNVTDSDYEFSDNDTSAEIPVETTVLPTTEVQTTPNPPYESEFIVNNFCICDLKVGFCDVNCCCDEDCSADDRKVFTQCQVRPQDVLDTRYCFQKQIIVSNHTEYKVEYMQSGALCIMVDNLPQHTTYTTVKGVTSVEEYKQLEKDRQQYPWEHSYLTLPFSKVPYSVGSSVWGVNSEGFLFKIGIPESIIGSECETMESLTFLEDIHSSCNRIFHDVAEECESKFSLNAINFLSFSVVADPSSHHQALNTNNTAESTSSLPFTSTRLMQETYTDASYSVEIELPSLVESVNQSVKEHKMRKLVNKSEQNENWPMNTDSLDDLALDFQDLNTLYEGELLPIRIYLCYFENNEDNCTETKISELPQPAYIFEVCRNIVSSIHYIFIHNGTQGIVQVQAKVYLIDMNNGTTHFTQNFHAQYIWASVENNNVLKRSGRPGYVTGKPVLLGKKIGNTSEEGELKEAIHLDTDPGQWLTILAPGRGGRCDSRSQVTFGMEMRSGCIIQVNQDDLNDCQMLQSQFLELLLGPTLHDVSGLHIASYGDSSINNVAEWVPILVPEEPRSANFLGMYFFYV